MHMMNFIKKIELHKPKNQKNYSQSVKCWTDDLKFIQKYKYGDLPEVLIGKIIVGKRE